MIRYPAWIVVDIPSFINKYGDLDNYFLLREWADAVESLRCDPWQAFGGKANGG